MIMSMCWDKLGGQTSKTQTLLDVQGDSGGSVMHLKGKNYETIGIVSWGVEGCQVHPKSAFHKIHNHGSKYPLFLKSPIYTMNNHDLWHEVRSSVSDAPSDLKPAVDPRKPWRSFWSWILSSTPLKDPACVHVRRTPSGIVSLLQAKANAGLLCNNIF